MFGNVTALVAPSYLPIPWTLALGSGEVTGTCVAGLEVIIYSLTVINC